MSHLHNRSFRLIFNFMSCSGTSNHTKCLNYELQVIFDDDVTNKSISMSHLHNRSFRLIFNFMSCSGTSNHTKCLNYELQVIFDDDVTNKSISMSHLHNRSFRLIFNFMSRSGSLAPQCDHAHLATSFILHLYENINISRFAAIGQFCV